MNEFIARANIGRFQKALKRARDNDERRVFLDLLEAERRLLRDCVRRRLH